ncbi:hypothetical protein G5B97_08390 [Campylobacter concisus]|uniref:hypothetical protein n=1 Tax=Campylobacter concisus TaxID=199 RepID=UPI0018AA69AD|nr:hypothetical protein [Campylobacter concisus]QPI00096.1 hypothetical protein G5B98_08180 [Campylobacter concisus]QPI01885.1 hypothetical protein G5B97_08390 [Campylobacter concisus]
MKELLREVCYSLVAFDKTSPLANCTIAILSFVGSLTFLFTAMFYLTNGVIFWRGVHVIALSLLLATAILFIDAYIRKNAEHKNTKN